MKHFHQVSVGFVLSTVGVLVLGASVAQAQTDERAQQSPRPSGAAVGIVGTFEAVVLDDFQNKRSAYIYTVKESATNRRFELHLSTPPDTSMLTGDLVSVEGTLVGSAIEDAGVTAYSGDRTLFPRDASRYSPLAKPSSPAPATNPVVVPGAIGSQSTLVMLVNFQDNTSQPFTLYQAATAIFTDANAFVQENSYLQTSFTGLAVGAYTIPESITTCNTSQIATDAQNAASAGGVNLSNYTHYVYLLPYDSACNFGGISTVGGNPSQTWLNGTLAPDVVNHELGHALGLWHSHSLDCGTTATICSNGTIQEYGDQMDVMGSVQTAAPDYNAFQKERLGWLNYGNSPPIQTVTVGGTYTITPYENGSGPKALKVLQSTNSTTGAKTWYYLESRQATGFDAFLTTWPYASTQNETTGVLFHLGTDGDGSSSRLLNMVPSLPTYDFEMSLALGQSFTDPTAGLTFTPTAVGSTGATVQITMKGASCVAASPTVSVSPSQSQSVAAGTAVNFTVTVKDNDSSACAPATFNLGDALPSGWAGVWTPAALSLSPGTSASATLSVTSPAGTAGGSYNIWVTAANASAPSYTASTAATYVVSTAGSLTMSVATNQSSYQAGQTVGTSVSLMSGTSPDAGAGVTVTIASPTGKVTTVNGTTGSNGVALLSYKLSKGSAAGTYGVQAATTATGASATVGASTSFTVQ